MQKNTRMGKTPIAIDEEMTQRKSSLILASPDWEIPFRSQIIGMKKWRWNRNLLNLIVYLTLI